MAALLAFLTALVIAGFHPVVAGGHHVSQPILHPADGTPGMPGD